MIFIILAFLPIFQCACPKDEYLAVNEITTFTVPKLPYQYDSLQPQYWSQVLYFHHDYIHASLVNSLNGIISNNTNYQGLNLTTLLAVYGSKDKNLWRYAGGHYNHCLFWLTLLSYKCSKSTPSGLLLNDIETKWGNFSNFQTQFNNNAKGLFGSGWVWLCVDPKGLLTISAKI